VVHLGFKAVPLLLAPQPLLRGQIGKHELLRTTATVKVQLVSSIEELDTRSMSLSARPYDLLVTVGSHALHADSSRAPPPGRHFWPHARMGLRGGVRARFDTVSTTVHHSLNAVARGRSGLLVQHGHRACSLCNRIYYGAGAHVPLDAQRLLRFACGLHGYMRTTRAHVPVKTAMEKKQTRERQRYTRTIASGPSGRWKKSSYLTPFTAVS